MIGAFYNIVTTCLSVNIVHFRSFSAVVIPVTKDRLKFD